MEEKSKVIRFRVTERTQKDFYGFCDKFNLNSSEFLRDMVEKIATNKKLDKFLGDMSGGQLNPKFDPKTGLFTMEFGDEIIQMNTSKFVDLTTRIQEEMEKTLERVMKDVIKTTKKT